MDNADTVRAAFNDELEKIARTGQVRFGRSPMRPDTAASQTGRAARGLGKFFKKAAAKKDDEGRTARIVKSGLTSVIPFGGAYQGYQMGKNEEELAKKERRPARYGTGVGTLGVGFANALAGNVGSGIGAAASGGHPAGALAGWALARGAVGAYAGAKRHEQEKKLTKKAGKIDPRIVGGSMVTGGALALYGQKKIKKLHEDYQMGKAMRQAGT